MDSAVGSGIVVTLPRISENGTATGGQQHPEIEGKSAPSSRNSFDKTEMLPRSLLSLLQQDDLRKESSATQVLKGIDEKQTSGQAHRGQLDRKTAVKLDNQDTDRAAVRNSVQETKVDQWRLTLHQIGEIFSAILISKAWNMKFVVAKIFDWPIVYLNTHLKCNEKISLQGKTIVDALLHVLG
ncbi:hypothetical protein L7F22_059880 [Adiantum nelumboides]|nr:hypothetical protein [Adiantum nelumboides]